MTSSSESSRSAGSVPFILLLQAIFLTTVIFNSSTRENFNLPKDIFFFSLIMIAAASAAAVIFFRTGRFVLTGLEVPFLILAAAVAMSSMEASSPVLAFREFFRELSRFLFFTLAVLFLRGRGRLRKTEDVLFLAAFTVALYGLFQYFGRDFLTRTRSFGGPGYSSFLGNKNFMASFLTAVFPAAFFSLIRARRPGRIVFLLILLVLSAFSILNSGTRGAWVGGAPPCS